MEEEKKYKEIELRSEEVQEVMGRVPPWILRWGIAVLFGILLILYLWNGILSMLPSSAVSGLVGVLIILTLIVVYIYQMTGNIVIAGVIEAAGVIAGVVVYFVKSSLYENLLTKMLGRLALADVFTDITSNSIVDITGIALYLSLIVVFVFLTVQAIQKRRWN